MANVLTAIRERIGPPPRRIPANSEDYFFARPPVTLHDNDELFEFYRQQEFLLREGVVGWGAIVRADFHAFEPGPADVAGIAIYSTEPAIDADPDRLWQIARRLYALKFGKVGTDVEEQTYADLLNTDNARGMGIRVPRSMAEGLRIRSTSIVIRRAHLPAGLMIGKYFPILSHPQTPAAMIVPSRAWPAEYAREWQADRAGYPAIAVINDFVKITQELADVIRRHKAEGGHSDDWYVRVTVPEPTDGFDNPQYDIDFVQTYNPKRHLLSESHGQRILIDASQADLLAGLSLGKADPNAVTA